MGSLAYKYRGHRKDDLYLRYELESLGERVMRSYLLTQNMTGCVDSLLDNRDDEARLLSIPMQTYGEQTNLLAFT